MTLQEFIEKAKTDAALRTKVRAAIMEKVILPMAAAEGVELTDEELAGVSGGVVGVDSAFLAEVVWKPYMSISSAMSSLIHTPAETLKGWASRL